jgi:predicted deacylase
VVIDLLLAFGAPITAVVAQPEASGTLVAAALEQGVPAIATELGGGGGVTGASLAVARDGVRRVLAHVGLLDSVPAPPASRLLVVEPAHFLRATRRGLFAPAFNLGDRVEEGDHAGVVLDPERPDQAGESLCFAGPGLVICRRVPALTEPGDVLAHLGADVTRAELISRAASAPVR